MFDQIQTFSDLYAWFAAGSAGVLIKFCAIPLAMLTLSKAWEELWKQLRNLIKLFKIVKRCWGEAKASSSKLQWVKRKVKGWYDAI